MSWFGGMKIYTVHKRPDDEKPVFVREGFSLLAFVFTFFWAFYYRLWAFAAVILVGDALIFLLRHAHVLHAGSLAVLQLAFSITIGYVANDRRRARLQKQGYVLADITASDSELRAEQRYFERYVASAMCVAILLAACISTVVYADTASAAAPLTMKEIVERLDVTSFPNSIGPRREKTKHTFQNYGFMPKALTANAATLQESDAGWVFYLRLLHASPSDAVICLEDQAQNGGSYHTQFAYLIKQSGTSALLTAQKTHDADCAELK